MSRKTVKQAITAANLPSAHMAFPEGSAPDLPWCCFGLDSLSGFDADNTVFAKTKHWWIELYQRTSDETVESALETQIQNTFGPFNKTEVWIDSESVIQTTYTFTEIEKENNNG